MFSGFDFKRFSLDALQDEDNEEATPATPLSVVPEHAERSERTETPPPQNKKLPPTDEDTSEWDWDQDNTAAQVERTSAVAKVGASEQRREDPQSQRASPEKSDQIDGQGNRDAGELGDTGRPNGAYERRDPRVFPDENAVETVKEEVLFKEMVRLQVVLTYWLALDVHS